MLINTLTNEPFYSSEN